MTPYSHEAGSSKSIGPAVQSTTRRGQRRLIPARSNCSCASIATRLDAGLTLRKWMPLMWIHASRAYSLVSKETFERERCWKRSWTPVPQPITKHQKQRSATPLVTCLVSCVNINSQLAHEIMGFVINKKSKCYPHCRLSIHCF